MHWGCELCPCPWHTVCQSLGASFSGFCRSTPKYCRSDSVDAWETPSILVLPVAEAEQRFMRVVKNTSIDSWSYISLSDLVRFAFCVQTSFGCCCVPLSWFQRGKSKGKVISIDLIQAVRGKTGDSSKEVLVHLLHWCSDALFYISSTCAEYVDILGMNIWVYEDVWQLTPVPWSSLSWRQWDAFECSEPNTSSWVSELQK